MIRSAALALLCALAAPAAWADTFKSGEITVEDAWARATPKGAPVGVGYLTIRNDGATPDRLIGGASEFAAVQLHEMSMADGVMKMREVAGGLEIPAHGAVTLKPSGYHLMFVGLKQPLALGEKVRASLKFEHAGDISVLFAVRPIGATSAGETSKDGMKGMKM